MTAASSSHGTAATRTGRGTGVFARRFSTDGTPQATEFQVNAYTAGYQIGPVVATDPDGDFVIAWTSDGQDGYIGGVFARRFNSGGMALGVEFQVNTYTQRVRWRRRRLVR